VKPKKKLWARGSLPMDTHQTPLPPPRTQLRTQLPSEVPKKNPSKRAEGGAVSRSANKGPKKQGKGHPITRTPSAAARLLMPTEPAPDSPVPVPIFPLPDHGNRPIVAPLPTAAGLCASQITIIPHNKRDGLCEVQGIG
jgi:hypothetical protein